MAASRSPTVQRRRLSQELRRLREQSGRTATDVARALTKRTGDKWETSKITRMERNEWRRPSIRDIRDVLDEYGVSDDRYRDFLLRLAREGRERGWWDTKGLWSAPYSNLIGLEAEAHSVRNVRTTTFPGLLQTADYAKALMRSGPSDLAASEIQHRVDVRLERQKVLTRDDDDPLNLWVVLDEAVLHRMVGGPEVMREQLRHALDMAETARVTLQVVPFAAGAHPAVEGSFAILKFPDPEDLDAVYLESIAGELFVEEPAEVRQYDSAFQRLAAIALSPEATLELIAAEERKAAQP